MHIIPLSDRIVVEPVAIEELTKGGLIIPEMAKERPQQATVVAVGKGRLNEPLIVKVGDKVLYAKFSGTEIELNSKKYLIMRECELFAII